MHFFRGKPRAPQPAPYEGEVPRHVAIIMDGNGRWAKSKHLPRLEGHRQGAKTVRMVVEQARRLGIRYLTVYAFSTENWGRPGEEVSGLMKLFQLYLENELSLFKEHNVRLRAIGDRSRLPATVQAALEKAEETTRSADGMDFIIAISYGGREELVQAAKKLAKQVEAKEISVDEITEEKFAASLYTNDVPEVDLLIRTSDEFRISNFLLWQIAYAEIIVSPVYWPEFSAEDFKESVRIYCSRKRRFGLTDEQCTAQCDEIVAAEPIIEHG